MAVPADYPSFTFESSDYWDPNDKTNDQDEDRSAPGRQPPVIHLHWMWVLIHIIMYILNATTWIGRKLENIHKDLEKLHAQAHSQSNKAATTSSSTTSTTSNDSSITNGSSTSNRNASGVRDSSKHHQSPDSTLLPIQSHYDVASHPPLPADSHPNYAELFFPGWLSGLTNLSYSLFLLPIKTFFSSANQQFKLLSHEPGMFLLGLIGSIVYAGLDILLRFIQALTGHTRSWVNVLDDSFDLQYCIKDLQPIRPAKTGQITKSGLAQILANRDKLYPYDLHAHAGIPPTLTPLDVVTAFISKLAYEEGSTVSDVLQQEWSGITWDPIVDDCQYDNNQARLTGDEANVVFQSRAILLHTDEAAIVCFRGTYPTAIVQWLTDFSAQQVEYPGQVSVIDKLKVRLHHGFFTALGLSIIGNTNYPESLFTQILRRLNEEPYKRVKHIYVCGHSLGAALATTFSYAVSSPLTEKQWTTTTTETAADTRLKTSAATPSLASSPPRTAHTVRVIRKYDTRTGKTETVNISATPAAAPDSSNKPSAILRFTGTSSSTTTTPVTRNHEASSAAISGWLQSVRPRLAGVYVFGSPRVGNDQLCNQFDKLFTNIPVHRFINQADIITRLPPPISGTTTQQQQQQQQPLFDYAHVDGLRFLDQTQRVPWVVNQDAPPTPWIELNIVDHIPGSYVRHINSALNAQIRDINTWKLYKRLHSGE